MREVSRVLSHDAGSFSFEFSPTVRIFFNRSDPTTWSWVIVLAYVWFFSTFCINTVNIAWLQEEAEFMLVVATTRSAEAFTRKFIVDIVSSFSVRFSSDFTIGSSYSWNSFLTLIRWQWIVILYVWEVVFFEVTLANYQPSQAGYEPHINSVKRFPITLPVGYMIQAVIMFSIYLKRWWFQLGNSGLTSKVAIRAPKTLCEKYRKHRVGSNEFLVTCIGNF